MKKVQHDKIAIWDYNNATWPKCNTKRVQHEKKCNMKKAQREKSATWKTDNSEKRKKSAQEYCTAVHKWITGRPLMDRYTLTLMPDPY